MREPTRPVAEFPNKFRVSTNRSALWYGRVSGLYAIHGDVPPALEPLVVFRLHDGQIAVCRGEPEEIQDLRSGTISPVYALEPHGPPAVPTGRLLVRFAEHVGIGEREALLRRSGYHVAQDLPYAPQAAWVQAAQGGIAASLNGIPRLEQLPAIMNVEPEMLMQRAHR